MASLHSKRAKGFAKIRCIIFLLMILSGYNLHAQKRNTSPVNITENNILYLNDSAAMEDSSLTHFESYKPVEFVQDLGNLASPYRFMYLPVPSVIGFNTGWYTPAAYFNSPQGTKYYKATVPYTIASYATGQRPSNYLDNLQQVTLLHTQNWGPLFNIGVRINSNRCSGFSTNAEARTGSGQLFTWFHSRNNKYQIIANATFNNSSNKLNGGIINDSSYESSSGVTKEIDGRLIDSSLFRYRSQQYYVKQFYRFGNETQQLRTRRIKRDSVVTDTIRNIDTRMQLSHSILFSREAWIYQDNITYDKNFYSNYFYDSLRTSDTLHQNTLLNSFDITYKTKNKILLYAAYENRLHWIYQNNATTLMNENFIRARARKLFLTTDSINGLLVTEDFNYCLFNNYKEFSQGDYLENLSASVNRYRIHIKLTGTSTAQAPSLLQVYYNGNHFYWYNSDLKKTKTNALALELKNASQNTSLKVTYSRTGSYTYFDSYVSVQQAAPLNYLSLQWKQDFKFKALHYTHLTLWQTTSNAIALPLPKILLKATLMYDDEWFKKALHIQFGASVTYFTKYFAPAFMPSVNVFYTQNEKEIGNYPQLDGFVNLQIQRVRIFIILEHFNQDLQGFGTSSYITPHYPIPSRAVRFGVSWSFYN
jgi:hypothetical protein